MRALFAPDGQTVMYGAMWDGQPFRLFLTRLDSRGETRLSFPEGLLFSISPSAELAIGVGLTPQTTLAQAPMLGGSPPAILEGVTFADWNASGSLVIARVEGSRQLLESPPGTVLHETNGELGWPRFSRNGDLIAFLDWPVESDDRGAVNVIDLKGQGEAQQFSPDGRWVLSVAHGPPVRLLLLPTGPGQPRTVQTGAITVTDARWLPGGHQLVLIGTEEGRGRRAYVIDLNGG